MKMNTARIEALRERFPKGTIVELDEDMFGEIGMPKGLRGEVVAVDSQATIHVEWRNGRTLGLIYGEDSFSRKFEQEQKDEQNQDNESQDIINNQGHQM